MGLDSTDEERLAGLLSRLGWSELLIGPYLVELELNSDGTIKLLRCRSLIGARTLEADSSILPEEHAWLLSIASPVQLNGGLDDRSG